MFDYPQWSIIPAAQASLLHTAIALAAMSLVYAVFLARKWRSAVPIYVFLGAGLSVFYEPLGDLLSGVAYAPINQVSAFETFGRPTPLWMVPNYFFFFCTPVLALLQFVVRPNTTCRRWWLVYGLLTIGVGLFEQPGINAEYWRYYAVHQAFSLNTYPIWVAFDNAQTIFTIAVGIYVLQKKVLYGAFQLALIPLMPILLVAAHVGVSLPVSSADYSSAGMVTVDLSALLTIVLCILNVSLGYCVITKSQDSAR